LGIQKKKKTGGGELIVSNKRREEGASRKSKKVSERTGLFTLKTDGMSTLGRRKLQKKKRLNGTLARKKRKRDGSNRGGKKKETIRRNSRWQKRSGKGGIQGKTHRKKC